MKPKHNRFILSASNLVAALPALALISLSTPSLMAQDRTWGGTGSTTTTGDYSTATNWSSGAIPSGGSQTDRAIFNGVNGAAATAITVNSNRTARFVFSGSTSYTLSGGSFTAGGGADMVNLDSANAASQTVNSDMYFGAAAGQINIIRNSSTGGRTLNMGGNIGGQTAASGIANALQINSGTGNTIVMSGTITDTLAGRTNNGGVFNIQKTGGSGQSGNLTLNGNNSYTGGTDYFAGSGSFTLGHKSALGTGDLRLSGGGVIINANTALSGANAIANTLRFNGTLASVAGTTDVTGITVGTNTATVSSATGLAVGQILNYQGVMRNFALGTYIASISGTNITLSTNALSTANISSGTARFQSYGSGGGTTTFNGSNAIEFSGTAFIGSERATSGTATQLFDVTNTGGVTFSGSLSQQNSIINGSLVQGALTKIGAGKLTLSGSNGYTGATQANGGTLELGSGGTGGTLNTSSAISIGTGGTLTINRSNAVAQGTDFSGASITGAGSFTQAGSGTTTLTVANGYSGGTTVTGGVLQLGNGGTTGSLNAAGSIAISSGANLTINRSNTVTQSFSLSTAAISGAGSFTQAGGGTTTLDVTNTYTGATNVNAGTLVVNGNISTSSLVSVSSGATLAGSGTVGAASVSGTLAIGNSPGTMNFSSLALGSGSTYLYEMTGGGVAADLGDISGALSINTASILDLVELGAYTVGNKFTLFAYDGAFTGNFSGLVNNSTFLDDLSNPWVIKYDDSTAGLNGGVSSNNTYVTITAIPEPSAALLGGLGVLALLRRRRNA